ncbi:hypothetical protein FDK12_09610 [Arthrobacter sp. NamB2]|uniref:hypothetical protein n=1 Tax=Arthrobacter sp. NamB2 TaxID=2576035 RepID=UPI0010C97F37|nr:hypothetical protein [Arthrobacter sp. NamB2]TKV28212.1 hypothetical protein FDK12_09610 [Arthrobacter sp. NamB2]
MAGRRAGPPTAGRLRSLTLIAAALLFCAGVVVAGITLAGTMRGPAASAPAPAAPAPAPAEAPAAEPAPESPPAPQAGEAGEQNDGAVGIPDPVEDPSSDRAAAWERTALARLGVPDWEEACGSTEARWACSVATIESPAEGELVAVLRDDQNDAELGETSAEALMHLIGFTDPTLQLVTTTDADGSWSHAFTRSASSLLNPRI